MNRFGVIQSRLDAFSLKGQRPRSTPSQGCCLLEHLRVWPELVLTVKAGEYLSGFDLYGIPIGESRFVKHPMSLKIAEVAKEVREVLEVLPGEGHAIWTVLRSAPS